MPPRRLVETLPAGTTQSPSIQEAVMRKVLEFGGFIAGGLLILFGAGVIALGVSARSTVHHDLSQEAIVGSADMTPAAIREEVGNASWLSTVELPSTDIAGKTIDTGSEARAFAKYMRIHTL